MVCLNENRTSLDILLFNLRFSESQWNFLRLSYLKFDTLGNFKMFF